MMGSQEYWKGYNDAKNQAERNWERARTEVNIANHNRFIEIVENAKEVSGVGPKVHVNLVEYVMAELMGAEVSATKETISGKERSRIIKELANTKWSTLSDDQVIAFRNILLVNSTEQA